MGKEDKIIAKLKDENDRLKVQVEDLKQNLEQCHKEKAMLQASYEEALSSLSDSEAKQETSARELRLAHDQMNSLWKELDQLRKQIDGSVAGNKIERMLPSGVSTIHIVGLDAGVQPSPPTPPTSRPASEELELHCTLCKEKIKSNRNTKNSSPTRTKSRWRLPGLESHSKTCVANDSQIRKEKGKSPSPPTSQSHLVASHTPSTKMPLQFLSINVTRTPPGQSDLEPFKIITKTNLPHFKSFSFEVYRSQGDFHWLHDVICSSCPERVVPPLKPQISLNATMLELQRFLTRISAHTSLREHHFVVSFLQDSSEDLKKLRAKHKPPRSDLSQEVVYKPSQGRDTSSGSLVQTKEYLESLEKHLLGFLALLEVEGKVSGRETPSQWFRKLSSTEPANTYLKTASLDLAAITESLEKGQGEHDEGLLKQNVESVIEYIKEAECLIKRIEDAVDRYLYWDEEVRLIETWLSQSEEDVGSSVDDTLQDTANQNDDSGMSETSGSTNMTRDISVVDSGLGTVQSPSDVPLGLSQRWSEAASHCQDAKEYLEMMCQDLAAELSLFDLLKETELKQLLIDYVTNQYESQEKSKSKWFSLKFILDTPIKPELRSIQFKTVEKEEDPTS